MRVYRFFTVALISSLIASLSLTSCSDDENITIPETPDTGVSPGEEFRTDDKIIFSCDFQDTEKAKSLFNVYDFSNLAPTSFMVQLGFSTGNPWIFKLQDSYTSKNYFAGATSAYNPAGAADAWLVTKAIEIPDSGYVLSWKSEALDLNKRDGLQVYISERGGNPETDFGEPVWQIDEEQAGPTESIDGEWQEHSLPLDSYAGKTIYVAFVNRSTDKSIICLDDVMISCPRPYIVSLDMEPMYAADEIEIRGHITAGDSAITEYDIHYTTADSIVRTEHYAGLNLQPGESHSFIFSTKLKPTEKGVYTKFKVWANVNELENVGVEDSVAAVNFIPAHRILLEEGTGMWCGYCPLGMLATEHLNELYPDTVIAVTVHHDDVLCDTDYDKALGFMNFPSGLINRKTACQPMSLVDEVYYLEGEGTFLNSVQATLKDYVSLEPSIESAIISGNSINVKSSVKFAIVPPAGQAYRLVYILTEDNVVPNGSQHNYFSKLSLPVLGEFGKGGKYGQEYIVGLPYYDVARGIYPEFKGMDSGLPTTIETDKDYDISYTINLDDTSYSSAENLYVTVAVLDASTGYVINSVRKQVR